MTYLALARKWRPKTFADVAGQGHVVRALENALNQGRLHHAFLFTGTRGVGKTTIARIFVKALNCDRGVSATPCGTCGSCTSIDAGRFVDFLELDAASRTGVDDTRELLENAQYAPAAGRFKVYLIDEVHMLSKSAFNALLKTLEEPPAHVKFLLATTDPQKIPVTVLSRCLQFNLKRLPEATIAERLREVCASEQLEAEPLAIQRLARAASGSMRDALSLLDQALAFGDGRVRAAEVAEMLGTLDRSQVAALAQAIAAGDGAMLLARVRELEELAPDHDDVLGGLATLWQAVAVRQLVPAATEAVAEGLDAWSDVDPAIVAVLAGQLAPEFVQLLYQIAVQGRRDLPLAPDPRVGFEMALLRMLAFQPGGGAAEAVAPVPATATRTAPVPAKPRASDTDIRDWGAFVATLNLDGAARQLARHCALLSQTAEELKLALDPRSAHLLTDKLKQRLVDALRARLGAALRVQIGPAAQAMPAPTPATQAAETEAEDLQRAREALAADRNVREMEELFGAQLVPESVRRAGAGKGNHRSGK
jgi:DNA polymerase-3 subunit gamma/tau